jgi:hypothetical protein
MTLTYFDFFAGGGLASFCDNQLALPRGIDKPDGRVAYLCGGTEIALLPREGGTKGGAHAAELPDRYPRGHHRSQSRSVTFLNYALPGLKTVDHVCVLQSEQAALLSRSRGQHSLPARGFAGWLERTTPKSAEGHTIGLPMRFAVARTPRASVLSCLPTRPPRGARIRFRFSTVRHDRQSS